MPADFRHARFLLIQMMHHGDVLLNTAVADALKQAWPDCTIDMLVYQGMQDVLLDNPAINEVLTVDRAWKKQGPLKHAALEIGLARKIRAHRYDAVLNFSNRWRAGFVTAASGAPVRLSYLWHNRRNALWHGLHTQLIEPAGMDTHTVDDYLNLLAPLALPHTTPSKVRMGISSQSRDSLKQKLAAQGWQNEPYILAHPGSRWFFKCWDTEKTAALLQKLLDNGHHILITAAPDAREHEMLQQLTSTLRPGHTGKLWLLDGVLTLRELAAAIDGARLFFGVDSVPMHMAAALGKPQVALFGPTWVSRWRPYSNQATVVWAGDYGELPHPNSIDVNTSERFLSAIPVEAVWQAIEQRLAEK